MLTRKYYKVIARVIKDNTIELVDETTQDGEVKEYINKDSLINDISIEFKKDNSLFNWDRFVEACND